MLLRKPNFLVKGENTIQVRLFVRWQRRYTLIVGTKLAQDDNNILISQRNK